MKWFWLVENALIVYHNGSLGLVIEGVPARSGDLMIHTSCVGSFG